MFKLSAFTDEISQDFCHALKVMAEYGCEGYELRSAWDTPVHKLTDEQVSKIKSMGNAEGIKCCSIAGPVFKCNIESGKEYHEHLDILSRCIETAHSLGSPIVRAFTFWRTEGIRAEDVWQKLLEMFRPAVEKIEEAGLILAIENEYDTFIGSGKTMRRFIDDLGSDKVCVIWDPCNVVFDYESEPAFPDGYNAVRELIAHVHIKDAVKEHEKKSAKCVAVGDGEAMIPELIDALNRDGYCGYVSLETHWRVEGELDKATTTLPGGKTFSSGAELASRICFDNMKKIIQCIA